jgi:hypothetical protein
VLDHIQSFAGRNNRHDFEIVELACRCDVLGCPGAACSVIQFASLSVVRRMIVSISNLPVFCNRPTKRRRAPALRLTAVKRYLVPQMPTQIKRCDGQTLRCRNDSVISKLAATRLRSDRAPNSNSLSRMGGGPETPSVSRIRLAFLQMQSSTNPGAHLSMVEDRRNLSATIACTIYEKREN